MLETGQQCVDAIAEIQAKTEWSLRRITLKSGLSEGALNRIADGKTRNPHPKTLHNLDKLLKKVRAM